MDIDWTALVGEAYGFAAFMISMAAPTAIAILCIAFVAFVARKFLVRPIINAFRK